jgi:hypothetical protein
MISLFAVPLDSRAARLAQGSIAPHDECSRAWHAQRVWFALLLVILGAKIAAANVPVSGYEARIHQAVIQLSALEQWEKVDTPTEHAKRVAMTLNAVREALPAEETIERDGRTVRVNNSWLDAQLQDYEKTPRYDPHRADVLARITERLRAMEDRLTELRSQEKVEGVSKDEEKARLEAILRRAEFNAKPPQESIFKQMWARFVAWLNSLFPRSNGLEPGQMSWLSFFAMIFIFALAAGVLGYVIYKLTPFFQRRRAKLKLEKREARIVLGERLAADQTAASLMSEAEALARTGELRAAIRKAYIALLCELGERKILTLAQHKTNHDYLRAVREKRPLLNEMQKLTNSFENHWYGFKQTTADDWTAFRSGYEKVLSSQF